MPGQTTPMRADARRNRDALLAAAAAAFAEHGTTTSLEQIARRAGVGVGTLYRHFPAREALVEAVYRRELEQVADVATQLLLDERSGHDALRAWSERFLEYAATKRGLGDALRAVMDAAPQLRGTVFGRLQGSVEQIVAHGIADGTIRSDARSDDLLRATTAIFHIPDTGDPAGWLDQSRRILTLLLDGLHPR